MARKSLDQIRCELETMSVVEQLEAIQKEIVALSLYHGSVTSNSADGVSIARDIQKLIAVRDMLKSMMVDGGRSLIWQMQIQVDQS
jgi:dihydroorotase